MRNITNRFAACPLVIILGVSFMVASCTPAASPPATVLKPVGSPCASVAIACFDELARQPLQLICFRPTSRWSTTGLTYRLANVLPGLDEQMQRDAVAQAFALWAEASQLSFTSVEAGADVTISFEEGDHGDAFPFDGVGSNLGHAFFPGSGMPGEVHLCATENWVIGEAQEDEIDLFTVLVHEIGHALGVEHSLSEEAVMGPSYKSSIDALAMDDIDSIQKLYGSADGSVTPLETPAPADFKEPANFDSTIDPDTDGDGIPDSIEVFVLNTDPVDEDSDGDGTPDFMEVFVVGTDPIVSDVTGSGDNKLQVQLLVDGVENTVLAVGDSVSFISSIVTPNTLSANTEFYQLVIKKVEATFDPTVPSTDFTQLSIFVDDISVLNGSTFALADFPGLVQLFKTINDETIGGQFGSSNIVGGGTVATGIPSGTLSLNFSGGRITGSFDFTMADDPLLGTNRTIRAVANGIDMASNFSQIGSGFGDLP